MKKKPNTYTAEQMNVFHKALAGGASARVAAEEAGINKFSANSMATKWRRANGLSRKQKPRRKSKSKSKSKPRASTATATTDTAPQKPDVQPDVHNEVPASDEFSQVDAHLQNIGETLSTAVKLLGDVVDMLDNRLPPSKPVQRSAITNGANPAHTALATARDDKPAEGEMEATQAGNKAVLARDNTATGFYSDITEDEVAEQDYALIPDILECHLSGWQENEILDELPKLSKSGLRRILVSTEFQEQVQDARREMRGY